MWSHDQPPQEDFDSPAPTHRPRVVDGGAVGLDIERFAATMAMLEHYVDGLLVADGPPTMDPWLADEDIDIRLSCL